MLTQEENDLLTRTAPGTPMGRLIRRYWVPAGLSSQITKPDGPPVRVTLLHEKLVMFRDSGGRAVLMAERCPHRGASMFFGRNEEEGLRCVYHGWKFDREGRCVDMPSEPPDSNFKHKVTIAAYPCQEHGGIVWAYLGPREHQPPFPALEWAHLPEGQVYVTRHVQECNWFQGFEGGFDASHLTFLHSGDTWDGDRPLPVKYEPLSAPCGMLFGTARPHEKGLFWSVEVMAMPFHKLITLQPNRPRGAHMWVPIDDENCMIYSIEYQPEGPLDQRQLDRSYAFRYIHAENLPGSDRCLRNRDNDYLIDRERQASGKSYTGLFGFGIQDCGIQESMGPISDRTVEHLGVSDIHLIQLRRRMLAALRSLDAGEPLPGSDPASYRVRTANFVLPEGQAIAPLVAEKVRVA